MLTAEQVTDQCVDNERPTVEEIVSHFEGTIFWNWSGDFAKELFNEQRHSEELPMSVSRDKDMGDGYTDRELHFESGECCIHVATVHQGPSDETAHETDAHFIANLPVYLPVLFREIEELRKNSAALFAIEHEQRELQDALTAAGLRSVRVGTRLAIIGRMD